MEKVIEVEKGVKGKRHSYEEISPALYKKL